MPASDFCRVTTLADKAIKFFDCGVGSVVMLKAFLGLERVVGCKMMVPLFDEGGDAAPVIAFHTSKLGLGENIGSGTQQAIAIEFQD
jgi:hypothetical protein